MVYKLCVSRPALLALLCIITASTVLAQAPRPASNQSSAPSNSQIVKPSAAEFNAEAARSYAKRLKQDKIDGHYIPSDVVDAMRELDKRTSTSSQTSYASRPEDFVVQKLYFSFGRWMGVNWGLYDGSRLSAHLRELGVDQPDGQIDLLMRLYHRHLTGKDLAVKELADAYMARKAAGEAERISRGTVIDSFTRSEPRPVEGNRPRG